MHSTDSDKNTGSHDRKNTVTISFKLLTQKGMPVQHRNGTDLGQVWISLLMLIFTSPFPNTPSNSWVDRAVKGLILLSKRKISLIFLGYINHFLGMIMFR